MSHDRVRWTLWGAFGAIVAVSWWHPPYPVEQALHHSLTLVAVAALRWLQRRGLVPLSSLVLLLVFLTLHTIAARWMYSFVPYDDWLERIAGVRLSELWGWRRNNFDRIVHLGYGLCLAPVLFTFFTVRRGWRAGWVALAAVDIIISTGAGYELLEWGVAAIAALGAVVAMALVLLVRARTAALTVHTAVERGRNGVERRTGDRAQDVARRPEKGTPDEAHQNGRGPGGRGRCPGADGRAGRRRPVEPV
jgi:putative membrane protein